MNNFLIDTRIVAVDMAGRPIPNAQVALVAPNGTYLKAMTNEDGLAVLRLPDRHPGTLYVAAPGHRAYLQLDFTPQDEARVVLDVLPQGGATLIEQSEAQVPGLSGRLTPLEDQLDRHYIYGDNISFDDSYAQPHPFEEGRDFVAEDAYRQRFRIIIVQMVGRTGLLQYQREDR